MKSLLLFLSMAIAVTTYGQEPASQVKYTKVPCGYLMVLHKGDNIFYEIENFANHEKIPSANFSGLGFVNITFGYFDFKAQAYKPQRFEDVELTSLTGSLATKDGRPSIHAHGAVAGKNFSVFGGHILDGFVSTGSVEILFYVHDKSFVREKDAAIGADVLQLH